MLKDGTLPAKCKVYRKSPIKPCGEFIYFKHIWGGGGGGVIETEDLFARGGGHLIWQRQWYQFYTEN